MKNFYGYKKRGYVTWLKEPLEFVTKEFGRGFDPRPNTNCLILFQENPFYPFRMNPLNPLTDLLTYFNRAIRLVCVASPALS